MSVCGFTVPEPAKRRRRIIFEPAVNRAIGKEELPLIKYPSRLMRRAELMGSRYVALFDFAAFFDQFQLAGSVKQFFVIRVGQRFFTLNQLPMGARFSPAIAQYATWLLVDEVCKRFPGVRATTMVDNVRFAAAEEDQFVGAVRYFIHLCDALQITLNDNDEWRGSDEQVLQRGRELRREHVFLGERFVGDQVGNAQKCIDKMEQALERLQSGEATRRNVAALIGLLLFMAHTVDIRLCDHFELMRSYSNVMASTVPWDHPFRQVSDSLARSIKTLAEGIRERPLVPITQLRDPSCNAEDYDAVVIIDACKVSWGAYVFAKGEQPVVLMKAFREPLRG